MPERIRTEFYKKIAEKLNDISAKSKSFSGFCLLPDEKSSFVFNDNLKGFDTELRHLTQGGKHIRVAVFESADLDFILLFFFYEFKVSR